ncbi:O-antigen ligase family protein [Leifsonia sp. ALI-44-B]|uniref:O-antigen ligase family protein n=1 Tax=Leifsonia sp. ALI-44-B TaxID=1933776 RepID=UPI00117ACE17|nr:O-antigen ligase family protein [Leifsonia sp. ALI-44-B]
MLEEALTYVAVFVAVVFVLSLLLSMKPAARATLLAVLVGMGAGLIGVQIAQVHVFTILLLIWVLFSKRASRSIAPIEAILTIVAAALLASTVLYGELVNSPTLGLQLLALAGCTALIVIFASASDVKAMLYGLLIMTSASSVFGLLQIVGIAPYDVWHLSISALGRPTGLYSEPDWLGMMAGVGLVLAWRLPLQRWVRVLLILANMSAWVLAFARAAWVAVVASAMLAVVVYLITRKKSAPRVTPKSGRILATALSGVVAILAFSFIPSLHDNLVTRLSQTLRVADNDVSAQARVAQNDGLNYLASTSPWYGWGLSTSGRVGVSGRLNFGESRNNVGSNWVVSFWVDGGLLSVALLILFGAAVILTLRTIQSQVLVLVLLSSFFSNAVYQPVTWLMLGLCLSVVRMRRERTAEQVDESESKTAVAHRFGQQLVSRTPA